MKNLTVITITLFAGIFFSACSHKITRTGYQIDKSDYVECDVVIKRDTTVDVSLATRIGEIKLGDSGLSVACNEEHAINILKGEACAMNAGLIIITEEKSPTCLHRVTDARLNFISSMIRITGNTLYSDEVYE